MYRNLLTLLLILTATHCFAQQTWVDSTGKYSVEATFKELDSQGNVALAKPSGEIIKLPLEKLNSKSQLLARFLASERPKQLAKLRSQNRIERLQAAESLNAGGPLPGIVKEDVLALLGLEVANIRTPQDKDLGNPIPDGSEESLLRVKADPKRYLDKPIVFCGRVEPSSYYNYGYDNAEDSHYSLSCVELLPGGEAGERVSVYVSREFSELLIERVASNRDGIVIRLTAKIDSDRYKGADTWDLLELSDWQYYNPELKKWEPSVLRGLNLSLELLAKVADVSALMSVVTEANRLGTSESVDLIIRALALVAASHATVGEDDVPAVVDVITQDKPHGPDTFNLNVRRTAAEIIGRSDAKVRRKAISELKRSRAKKDKPEDVKAFASMAIRYLETIRK